MSPSKEIIRGKVVDRNRDHKPCYLARIVFFTLQDVVCQERFLDVSACSEQPAGIGKRFMDLGDDSRGAENRELRAERRQQVTAMTLPPMIGMDRDLVDERTGGRLAPIRTPIGSAPENATMQLLHQT